MARFRLIARLDRELGGTCPVMLRISHQGQRCFVQLDVRVKKSWWDEKRQAVRRRVPDATLINRHLADTLALAEMALNRLAARGEPITAARIRTEFVTLRDGPAPESLVAFGQTVVADYRKRGQDDVAGQMRTVLRYVEQVLGDVAVSDFDAGALRHLETYLISSRADGGRGLQHSTAHNYIKKLQRVYRLAEQAGRVPAGTPDPFRHVSITPSRTERHRLSRQQFETLEAMPFLRPELNQARDYFLLMVYLSGLRWSDLATLRRRDMSQDSQGRRWLTFTVQKTGNPHTVYVPERAWAILERYDDPGADRASANAWLLPILAKRDTSTPRRLRRSIRSAGDRMRRWLIPIGEALGLSWKLTPHVARHTFAALADDRLRDVRMVQLALGHSDPKITQRYLAGLNPDRYAGGMDQVF